MHRTLRQLAGAGRARLRDLAGETRRLAEAVFALTPLEREAVVLVCALFVLGLAVRWLRWWLES